MTFQTDQDDQSNGYKNSSEELQMKICSKWLGIVNLFQTYDDLESIKDKHADIQAVSQLLDVEPNDY